MGERFSHQAYSYSEGRDALISKCPLFAVTASAVAITFSNKITTQNTFTRALLSDEDCPLKKRIIMQKANILRYIAFTKIEEVEWVGII